MNKAFYITKGSETRPSVPDQEVKYNFPFIYIWKYSSHTCMYACAHTHKCTYIHKLARKLTHTCTDRHWILNGLCERLKMGRTRNVYAVTRRVFVKLQIQRCQVNCGVKSIITIQFQKCYHLSDMRLFKRTFIMFVNSVYV